MKNFQKMPKMTLGPLMTQGHQNLNIAISFKLDAL